MCPMLGSRKCAPIKDGSALQPVGTAAAHINMIFLSAALSSVNVPLISDSVLAAGYYKRSFKEASFLRSPFSFKMRQCIENS